MKTVTSMWGEEPASRQSDERAGAAIEAVLRSPTGSAPAGGPWTDPPRPPAAPVEPPGAPVEPPGPPAVAAPAGAAPVARLTPLRTPGYVRSTGPAPVPRFHDDTAAIWVPDRDRVLVSPAGQESPLDAWLEAPRPRRGAQVAPPGAGRNRPRKPPRRPSVGLAGMVLLSLLAAFFAWVSAEPLWLAVGHGDRGTATVTRCAGTGVGQRCVGEFTAAGGEFTVAGVAMLGLAEDQRTAGATMTARMVSADGRSAYADDRAGLHLRWAVGLLLVLACGLGIAVTTGAGRLDSRAARIGAVATSLAAPLLITLGFLVASF